MQTMVSLASPAVGTGTAEMTVAGPRNGTERAFVVVNGERAFSGRTFISNGTVSTTETSSAIISLGKLGRVEIAPASTLNLSFSETSIAAVLSKGSVTVSNTEGVSVSVDTPDDLISNERKSASSFTVNVRGERTGVAVATGDLRSESGALPAKHDDDDDDDDDDALWIALAFGGGFLAGFLVATLVDDEDDDTVSPVR
jgi:hypothetical protein